MTLLVRRHKIAFVILLALSFTLGMSVFTYLSLQGFGELSAPEQKKLAERIFLVGVVGTVAVVAGLLMVVQDAVNLSAVFKRLSAMHRMGGDQIQMELRRLGSVGEQIDALYGSINALSARKTTRISGMNALLTAVLRRADANMVIVNASGKVYQATPAALKRFELTHAEIAGLPVDKLVEIEMFTETAAGISKKTEPYRIGEDRDSIVVLPVTNDQGLVAYYIYLLGNDARDELKQNPLEPRKLRNGSARPAGEKDNDADAGHSDPGDGSKRKSERPSALGALFARFGGRKNGR